MTLTQTIRLARRRAFLQLDMAMALSLLALVFIPLSVSSSGGLDLARRHYFEAVALKLIDGEMDVLLAGERRKHTTGEHRITPIGEAVQNLPEGEFVQFESVFWESSLTIVLPLNTPDALPLRTDLKFCKLTQFGIMWSLIIYVAECCFLSSKANPDKEQVAFLPFRSV